MNKTSMLYWYPLTKSLNIPQPKTEVAIRKEIKEWFPILDKGLSKTDKDILFLKASMIGYPLFMRTNYSSAKHDFKNTCYVPDRESLLQHIFNLFETNYCRNLYPEALILREYIELDWKFKAFLDLPIAPERRYFISDGEVVCHHPYWPEDAIKFYTHNISESYPAKLYWHESLAEMNIESPEEIKLLKDYATKIGSVLEGEFSVDFAKGRNGKWYFIDAASAIQSWHPEETEHSSFDAPEQSKSG